jgi:hypothetical protein
LLDVIDGDVIKPFIAVYMIVGSVLLESNAKKISKENETLRMIAFWWFYGCCGRWWPGSIVTSQLGRGRTQDILDL